MIRVVNIKNYKLLKGEIFFKVDRTTPLGNPFYIDDNNDRRIVCKKYKLWFDKKVKDGTDQTFINYLNFIIKKAKKYDIALGCWCYPQMCHGDIVKNYIDELLNLEP